MRTKFISLLLCMLFLLAGCAREEIAYDHDADELLKGESRKSKVVNTSGDAAINSYKDVHEYKFNMEPVNIATNSGVFFHNNEFQCSELRKSISTMSFEIKALNNCLFKNFVLQVQYYDANGESIGVLNTEACDFISDYNRFILINIPEKAESFSLLTLNCSQELFNESKDSSLHTFEEGCESGEVIMESANYFKYELDGSGILFLLNENNTIITSKRVNSGKDTFTSEGFGAQYFIYYQ